MKKNFSLLLISMACSVLTGCSNQIPEMSQQQQDVVVEYAVSALLKYQKGTQNKLVLAKAEMEGDTLDSNALETDFTEKNILTPEKQEESQQEQEMQTTSGNGVSESTANEIEQVDKAQIPIAEMLGMDKTAIDVSFDGIELVDYYSDGGEQADAFDFGMKAGEGKKLLVAKFTVSNNSQIEQHIDVLSQNIKMRFDVNGKVQSAYITFLESDISILQTDLMPGKQMNSVLIGEVYEDTQIDSIAVQITRDDQTQSYNLK